MLRPSSTESSAPKTHNGITLRVIAAILLTVFLVVATLVSPAALAQSPREQMTGEGDSGSTEQTTAPDDSAQDDSSGETSPREQMTGEDTGDSTTDEPSDSGGGEQSEEPTDSTSPREEMTGDDGSGGGSDSGDDGGLGTSIFTGIVSYIFGEPIETNARLLIDLLTGWAFALPAPEGEIRDYYDRTASVVQPGAVTLLLITGLLMGVRGASYTTSYATQSALPKIALFIAGLSFFPDIMVYISNLTSGIAGLLIDQETMANALQRVMRNQALLGLSFIGGIVNLCVLILTFGLVLIAIAKSFIFAVFFIAGPLAMFLYPIRPLSGIAVSWLKGTLACVAIPLLWAVEVWVGTAIIESPEMVFGDTFPGMGMFTAMTVLILTWIMIKTPFKVYEYCFYGYSSGNSFISSVGKSVAVGAIGSGLRGGGSK